MASKFALLAVSAVFSFAGTSEKLSLPKELQTATLPWFALEAKDGEGTYNGIINNDKLKEIAQRRNSKRIVFAFFATWCAPCKEGLSRMSLNAAELEKRGILVVLINIGENDYGKIDEWAKTYLKEQWLLGFDSFRNLPEDFGLSKRDSDMPLPKTLLLSPDLKPLMLLGNEGDDFPKILWSNL
jgi:thiol-disulfide isomerase/thioredoxin